MTTPPQEKAPGALGALILHHTVTAMLIVGGLALGIWGYLTYTKDGFTYAKEPMAQSASQRYLIASQVHRLTLAAHTYQKLHQSPPLTLDILVEEGIIRPDDLSYPSPKVSYAIHIRGDQLVVTSTLVTTPPIESPPEDDVITPL